MKRLNDRVMNSMEDLVIHISTVNGTGSQSANQLLTKILFRNGFSVGSYNFFPSNIAGLPSSYFLRINNKSYTALQDKTDLLINLNPKTLTEDLKILKPSGTLITDKKDSSTISCDIIHKALPLNQSLIKLKDCPLKVKKVLKNIVYVGLISQWLGLERDLSEKAIKDFFSRLGKGESLIEINLKAFHEGCLMAETNPLNINFEKPSLRKNNQILIDGNSATALGALFSGCQFLSWYPITPATSLAENFEKYGNRYQKNPKTFTVIQTEDEIAALGQALGAGWAGLRTMTSTSGPGLSLMAEGAGLAYFAEVPAVICNVQRAGPSTGLPTRTSQGDLLSACFLSHGDTRHVVLMPGNVEECFSLTQKAFELADQLQTPVILLSDLDLAMNLQTSQPFPYKTSSLKRGKILKEKDLERQDFARYQDREGDGVSPRVLPGTPHLKAGYLTRGSGHDELANYSEFPEDYQKIQNKLKTKWEKARELMPKSIILKEENTVKTFVTFGKNESAVREAIDILKKEGFHFNYLRIRSYPLHPEAEEFLKTQKEIHVVEQNRDGQLKRLLKGEYPHLKAHFQSILRYNGRPFSPQSIVDQFHQVKKNFNGKIS